MNKPAFLAMGFGITAGTLAATLPTAFNILTMEKADEPAPRPQKIRFANGKFTDIHEKPVQLKILGINSFTPDVQAREKLCSRFGPYGMAQVCAAYEGAMLTDSDIKHVASLGFNCIRLKFSYTLIYRNGKMNKAPDFTALDAIINKCCMSGLYVILSLTDARTFEKKEKPEKNFEGCVAALAQKYRADNAVIMLDLADENGIAAALKAAPDMQTGNLDASDSVFTEKYPRSRFIKEHFENGESVVFEPFKSNFVALFTILPKEIDLEADSYDDIKAKYAALNESSIKDELIAGELKEIFGETEAPKTEKPKKFSFNADFRSGKTLTRITY